MKGRGPIRAIVFDCDGVLLESADVKTAAFAKLFGEICPDRVAEVVAYHLAHMGISRYVKFRHVFDNMLGRPLSAEQESELGRRFSELTFAELLQVPFVPGTKEFLEYARDGGGYDLFVASGSPENELLEIGRARGLLPFFREWHGSPKTKPAIIRDIQARYHLNSSQVVFVGDASSDREAADETGVTFVGRVVGSESPLTDCRYRLPDLTGLRSLLHELEGADRMRRAMS